MRKKAVPVKCLRLVIPRPVRFLRIGEDDPHTLILRVRVAPHIHVALGRARRRQPRSLEPRMLVARMIDDQLDHHLHVALVRRVKEQLKVVHRPVRRVHIGIVRDVISVIPQRRRHERQNPQARHAQVLQIIQPRHQPLKIADPVIVRVRERTHVQLIDNGVLIPKRITRTAQLLHAHSPKS